VAPPREGSTTSSADVPDAAARTRRRDPSLIVNIVDLRRHLGERRDITRVAELESLTLGDTEVERGAPIEIDLTLESIPAGIAVDGTILAPWRGTCRRCLDQVDGVLEIAVDEVFTGENVEGETYPLGHETIDLEPLVREAVLLSLPLGPLCRDDCAGPDPDAFPVEIEEDAQAEPGEEDRPKDPRWAALDVLRAEFDDDEAPADRGEL
jgi:uncharacterized protein